MKMPIHASAGNPVPRPMVSSWSDVPGVRVFRSFMSCFEMSSRLVTPHIHSATGSRLIA